MQVGQSWTASDWLSALERPAGGFLRALQAVYGHHSGLVEERLPLLRMVASGFHERFGGVPMRFFRSPGRINLRGMHVDTHGGYLNLMTHQREVVVAATPSADDSVVFANVDRQFEEVSFRYLEEARHNAFSDDWLGFITHPDIEGPVLSKRGHWGNYLRGAVMRVQFHLWNERLRGMKCVVGSDLPRGAALSSSSALSLAAIYAFLGCNGKTLGTDDLITIGKEAEWYTGARGGMSDQTAMVLGGPNELVNIALFPGEIDSSGARRCLLPEGVRILVINSYTERSISGAHLVEYTRNRFAYSLALEIVRQELVRMGMTRERAAQIDRLPKLAPDALEDIGGLGAIHRLLRAIPEEISIDELRERYDLPALDEIYRRYFGAVPPELQPDSIQLRGPLLFGIAESERARIFVDVLASGDYAYAGRLMTIGHDGDRRVTREGMPYVFGVDDQALARLERAGTPIHEYPGVYGASSPVLDALVDTALDAGALGASLTGAGIAGVVLALCRADEADHVAAAVRERLHSEDYAALAQRASPLNIRELGESVVINKAPDGAGEIVAPEVN